jgi:predicted acyltransferase
MKTTTSSKRLLSLDVFRGITIAVMILVNSPGNRTAYPFLKHAIWDGCHFADLVFPSFLFIVGVSLVFSFSKLKGQVVSKGMLIEKIVKRSVIIFLIGLFLNIFPHFDLSSFRITGVLQRIAICYMAAATLFLTTRVRTQALIVGVLLIGYWLLLMWVPAPGFNAWDLSPQGNLAGYIDRSLLSGHMYKWVTDPEGLLSTLPAIATTLLGNLTGVWLRSGASKQVKLLGLIAAGIAALGLGWVWSFWFPINKALWTSSFVMWTAGFALCLLAVLYGVIEIKHRRAWSKPFEILGVNAIAAYFLHIFFLKVQQLIPLQLPDGSMGNLRLFITAHLFGWASLEMASLLYAVSYVLFWLLVLWMLYRRNIFIKI